MSISNGYHQSLYFLREDEELIWNAVMALDPLKVVYAGSLDEELKIDEASGPGTVTIDLKKAPIWFSDRSIQMDFSNAIKGREGDFSGPLLYLSHSKGSTLASY
jgi:hypothetical protein